MDRLTWYDCYDGVYAQGIVQQDYDGATVFTGKPIDRLAQYEDTGLSPAEVSELAQLRNRRELSYSYPAAANDAEPAEIWKNFKGE